MSNKDLKKPDGAKKRRVIHWNPDDEDSLQPYADKKPRGPMFFLPLFAGFLVFGGLAYVGVKNYIKGQEGTPGGGSTIQSGDPGITREDLKFVSPQRVQREMDKLRQEISAIRKVTDDHPSLIKNLVAMETAFDEGNKKQIAGQYRQAILQLEVVAGLIEDQRDLISLESQSKEIHDKFLNLMEESETGRKLAPFEFEKASILGNEGEIFLADGNFTRAMSSFESALESIKELDDIVDFHMADIELDGKKALQSGDKETALENFRKVLELQPDNELALRNIRRAETIDLVLPLLENASELEKNGEFEKSLASFDRAFEIDPFSAKAQAGKSRLGRIIRENRLDFLQTTSKKAEEEKDWDTAIETYEMAVEEFPDHPEFAEALEIAREEGHSAKVAAALEEAYTHEEDFEWVLARDSFNKVLDLDYQNEEAIEGLRRDGEILRNLLRYEKFINDTADLAAKGEFQKAIRTFNEAMLVKPSNISLSEDLQELKATLRDQSQPVKVDFVSDGKTWVSIAGFQMIGKFEQHKLRILPGNYRVRGRRKGYRDVLLEVRVRSDSEFPPIQVVCTQRI